MLAVLDRHARNYPDLPLRESRTTLRDGAAQIADSADLNILRGQEGYLGRSLSVWGRPGWRRAVSMMMRARGGV